MPEMARQARFSTLGVKVFQCRCSNWYSMFSRPPMLAERTQNNSWRSLKKILKRGFLRFVRIRWVYAWALPTAAVL
jgi:hypothetical protein